jgi:protein-disulfide isomerase-like protein with CxxC motif
LAHEAARFAETQGLFDTMNTALFRAFFEDGRDIGDLAEFVKIGASIGMNAGELRQALDDGCHRKSVFADEELAMKLTISGVPALLIQRHQKSKTETTGSNIPMKDRIVTGNGEKGETKRKRDTVPETKSTDMIACEFVLTHHVIANLAKTICEA